MFSIIAFLVSIIIILLGARKHIGLSLLLGTSFLGIVVPLLSILVGSSFSYALTPVQGGIAIIQTFFSPSVVLIALSVMLIPLIGGTMEKSGQMESIVSNMRLPKKATISFLPAIMGMLPMPGGAVLSCPLVEKTGSNVSGGTKAAINIFFRHILFLVYPLSSTMIVTAHLAGFHIYQVIPYLFPFFLFAVILGYLFLLRNIKGSIDYQQTFSIKGLVFPLLTILVAPIFDFTLKLIVPFFTHSPYSELSLVIGILLSLCIATVLGDMSLRELYRIAKEAKIWNFVLIIFGTFTFLNVFNAAHLPEIINTLHIPVIFLAVIVSFFLGVGTGRSQAPLAIIIPILMASQTITPILFAITYFSVFLGYMLSPVHPCVSVSLEYLNSTLKAFLHSLIYPIGTGFTIVLILSFLLL